MDPVIHEGLDGDKFDEETTEREEFQLVFDHDSPLHPGKYSENESDEEGIRCGDGRLYKNQKFADGDTFKKSVINEALRTGRNLEQYRYDKRKMGFKCVGSDSEGKGCAWKIYASFLPKDETWRVRLFIDKHRCLPGRQCKLLKVPVISMMFRDKIREEPDYYTATKIKEIVKERWNIDISRPQCQAARNKALRNINREAYYSVHDYKDRLLESYEDSFITGYNRFYVCFDVLRRKWKESCRPLIGVDDCSRMSKTKGNVLVAVGRDANNATYPLAWGAVQVKNRDDWLWFVRNLKESLALNDGDGYIMVSNNQEELIEAVRLELPMIEHRKCVRHIYEELKRNYREELEKYYRESFSDEEEDDIEDDNDSNNDDEKLKKQKAKEKSGKLKAYEIILEWKPFIWKLACSYNSVDYKENYRSFDYKENDGSCDYYRLQYILRLSKPKSWCRAFYEKGNYCEDVENYFTESFIKFISKAREKSFIPMLETIRRLVMTQNAERSKLSHDHEGICTPYVTKFLAAEYKKASQCIVIKGTNGDYEAMLSGCSHCVNLEKRTCTCKKFEICGIPCEHAYGVILVEKLIPEDFVCHWFRTSTWKRNYEENLFPVGGFKNGLSYYHSNIGLELDKPVRKKVTKADKKRKKGVNQSPNKKQPKQKKCGLCKIAGHNIRFHKKQSKEGSQDQALDIPINPNPVSSSPPYDNLIVIGTPPIITLQQTQQSQNRTPIIPRLAHPVQQGLFRNSAHNARVLRGESSQARQIQDLLRDAMNVPQEHDFRDFFREDLISEFHGPSPNS